MGSVCRKCGNVVPDGYRFCLSCGCKLEPAPRLSSRFILILLGAVVLGLIIVGAVSQNQSEDSTPKSTSCSDAAKIMTVMLAKDGYHVTMPSPSGSEGKAASIGSTDMTKATVEEVKAALAAEHDTLMQLRAAGCERIGFYGDKLGTFGEDIDLDDLP